MKKLVVILVSFAALTLLGFTAYHFISPRVVVTNRSSFPVREVILALPSSRVTFAAVEPGHTSTVYYSPQNRSGKLHYTVRVNNMSHQGSQPYADSAEYGRVIRIDVDARGSVNVE